MTYNDDWQTLENTPTDTSVARNIDDFMRGLAKGVGERLTNMFYGFTGTETQEGIKRLEFIDQAADPTDVNTLYTKSGEIYLQDGAGNVVQLTSGGNVNGNLGNVFRSGDLLMSSNGSAPSGFSDVSATYADKFIRISSGTPLNTGGSDTHDHGGSSGTHTLTEAEMPSHTHGLEGRSKVDRVGGGPYNVSSNDDVDASSGYGPTLATGGDGAHSHSISSADNIPAYAQVKMYKKD